MSKHPISRKQALQRVDSSPVPKSRKIPKSPNSSRQSEQSTPVLSGMTKKSSPKRWATHPLGSPKLPPNVRKVDKTILYIDFETSPLICYTWGMWKVDVVKLLQDSYILSCAYRWGDGRVEYIRTRGDDKQLCIEVQKLFDEASIICAHNGDSFDIRVINTRMAFWGLTPPSPYKTIDTLKILKSRFKMTRNSLDFACKYFNLGEKLKHKGIDMWDNCMNDPDHPDWKTFERYNRKDVIQGWKLHKFLEQWNNKKPKMGNECKLCLSHEGQWRGGELRRGIKYKRWHCISCGKTENTDIKFCISS